MGNTCKGNSDRFKTKIDNKNVVLKSLVNYSSNKYLSYIGSYNKTFFFHEINFIVIQQQLSLHGQVKILKKWHIKCNAISLMNKTNEFVVLLDNEVKIFEIDSSYNLEKNCKTIFSCPDENMSGSMIFLYQAYQIQFSEKNDLIVASMQKQIFFLQKRMEGTWDCINKLDIDSQKFLLNQQGTILIILYFKQNEIYSNSHFEFAIYMKNNLEQWTILKIMEAPSSDCCFCFFDNARFAIMPKACNHVTIYQVLPKKLEVNPIQVLNLEYGNQVLSYDLILMKQRHLLIAKNTDTIRLIKNNYEKFYVQQKKQISDGGLMITNEGFLINFLSIFNEQTKCYKPNMMKIQRLYEN